MSTDDNLTWGGLGRFEYSQKGLPHGLQHQTELVMRGGHHLSACTCAVECAHKEYIKMASKFVRVYSSYNTTEKGMLRWVQKQRLWQACVQRAESHLSGKSDSENDGCESDDETSPGPVMKLMNRLPYTSNWSQVCASTCGNMLSTCGVTQTFSCLV